jgi:hypothetical protein
VEHFIDNLSKELAKTRSRRSMLSMTSRALFASFMTTTGIDRLWAQTSSTASTCPSCGTCERCNTSAGKCGLACENPCTAAVLCNQAQQFPAYLALQSFLANEFTAATSGPQAVVFQVPSESQSTALATTYAGSDPTITATLFFTEISRNPSGKDSSFSAFALQFKNGVPQVGYIVDSNGQLKQFSPPASASTSILASQTVAGNSSVSASQQSIGPICAPLSASTCEAFGGVICGLVVAGYVTTSIAAATAECATVSYPYIFYPPGVYEFAVATCTLYLLVGIVVAPPGLEDCLASFDSWCQCPVLCCGQTCPPLVCVGGVCQSIPCPNGYSCKNSSGMCTCDNLCGTTCCVGDCVNNTCITKCPSGYTPCGTTCCANGIACCGNTCCPQGQVCQNETCTSTTSCNPGFFSCGPANTASCCPTSYTCCSASGACFPSGSGTCCFDGECSNPSTCCGVATDGRTPVCCAPTDACCGAWCCPASLSCGSTVGSCVLG